MTFCSERCADLSAAQGTPLPEKIQPTAVVSDGLPELGLPPATDLLSGKRNVSGRRTSGIGLQESEETTGSGPEARGLTPEAQLGLVSVASPTLAVPAKDVGVSRGDFLSGLALGESAVAEARVIGVLEPLRAPESSLRRRKLILLVAGLALSAGILVVAVETLSSRGADELGGEALTTSAAGEAAQAATAQAADVDPRADGAQSSPPEMAETALVKANIIDSKAMFARAVSELRTLCKSNSLRIRRLAAMALARTEDPIALEVLRAGLKDDESEINRVQIAYALARAHDASGKQALLAALGGHRRDVKLDAASALVSLADNSGQRALHDMLSNKLLRLGAAELLVRLGDPDGLKVLHETHEKGDGSAAKLRAAVALGRAGDKSVQEELRRILTEGRFRVGAAEALAALGDPLAGPALESQLASSSMRVRAAFALRKLRFRADLAALVQDLAKGDEVARASAAEALLILVGPAELARHD
jgi:HEAT repeat protein